MSLRRPSYSCKFPSCTNTYFSPVLNASYKPKKFHCFPRDAALSLRWKNICNIPVETNCSNFYVCEDHFVTSDYTNPNLPVRLLPTAIPKLFDAYKRDFSSSNVCQDNQPNKLRKPAYSCKFPSCTNTYFSPVANPGYKPKKFHCFPRDAALLLRWKNICNIPIEKDCRRCYICEDHFVPSDFYNPNSQVLLSHTAVPKPFDACKRDLSYGNVCQENEPNELQRPSYSCKFPSCTNTYDSPVANASYKPKKFHCFPRDTSLLLRWKNICNIPVATNCTDFYVCEDHFVSSDFDNPNSQVHLSHTAVPKPFDACKRDLSDGNVCQENEPNELQRPSYSCKFPSCTNTYDSPVVSASYKPKKFHCFPRDPSLLLKWKNICNIPVETNCTYFYVCEDHVVSTDFDNPNLQVRLLPTAVPKPFDACKRDFSSSSVCQDNQSNKLRKPSYSCKFPSCKNTYFSPNANPGYKPKKFHRFPRDAALLLRWKNICNIPIEKDCRRCYVCEDHFVPSDFYNPNSQVRLSHTAVPKPFDACKRDLSYSNDCQENEPNELQRPSYSCKFPSCTNTYDSPVVNASYKPKKFHCFPRDASLLLRWKNICNIPVETNCTNFYVCEDHFVSTDFDNPNLQVSLLPTVVPKPFHACQRDLSFSKVCQDNQPNKLRRPSYSCKFPSCTNKYFSPIMNPGYKPKKFHCFPRDASLMLRWKNICNIPIEKDCRKCYICEDHFVSSDFNNPNLQVSLLPTAVPKPSNACVNTHQK